MKHRFDRFADFTTIHGIRDFNTTDKLWKKIFWAVSLICCTSLFLAEAYKHLMVYAAGGKTVSVRTLSSSDSYAFPPIILGVPDWIWMDMNKIQRYNISYEELALVRSALAPYQRYYSNVSLELARENLDQKLRDLNITGGYEFFSAFAYDEPPGLSFYPILNASMVTRKGFYQDICLYELNVAGATKTAPLYRIEFILNVSKYLDASRDQILLQMGSRVGKNDSRYLSFTKMQPFLLSSDFGSRLNLERGKYHRIVHRDVKVHRPLPCDENDEQMSMFERELCQYGCEVKANITLRINSCYERFFTITDYVKGAWPICFDGLALNETYSKYGEQKPLFRNLSSEEVKTREHLVRKCLNSCYPACNQTTFTTTVFTTRFMHKVGHPRNDFIGIEVNYPGVTAVTFMEEIYGYVWYDLVSNIGGVLGLCLGASIMSLFQLFHLCPCAGKKQCDSGSRESRSTQTTVQSKGSFGGSRKLTDKTVIEINHM